MHSTLGAHTGGFEIIFLSSAEIADLPGDCPPAAAPAEGGGVLQGPVAKLLNFFAKGVLIISVRVRT